MLLRAIDGVRAVGTTALVHMPVEALVAKRTIQPIAKVDVSPLPIAAPKTLMPVVGAETSHGDVD